jgi:hypothetical protein
MRRIKCEGAENGAVEDREVHGGRLRIMEMEDGGGGAGWWEDVKGKYYQVSVLFVFHYQPLLPRRVPVYEPVCILVVPE